MDPVEQPEGDDEDEDEKRDDGSEHEYSRQSGLGLTEENTPGANQEDQELEGKADQHSITGNITLQFQPPGFAIESSHLRQDDHEDWAEEGRYGEEAGGYRAEVLPATRGQTSLTGDLPLGKVLHRVLDIRVIRHSRCCFSPILVLEFQINIV